MAQYLIDSHIFLWAVDAPERLRASERKLISDPHLEIAVSVASFWELSIKVAKGLLPLNVGKSLPGSDYFARHAGIAGFRVLPINAPEAEYMRGLPQIHGDPFDRILIAQATLGNLEVITRDEVFARYPGVRVTIL